MRLEQERKQMENYAGMFQFHKGAIRTALVVSLPRVFSGFNSIKVRLELYSESYLLKHLTSFNSIKVRLELKGLVVRYLHFVLFQFHKGAIRTQRAMY